MLNHSSHLVLAIVSTALPPSASGQAKVIERLLRDRPGVEVLFLSDAPQTWTKPSGNLVARYLRLGFQSFGWTMRQLPEPWQAINIHWGTMRPVRERAAEIVKLLRGRIPAAIIGCSGNVLDLPASALVAERLRVPFIAYLFDDPVYQVASIRERHIAWRLEAFWAAQAVQIMCPNERLASDFKARTTRDVAIVRNPYESHKRAGVVTAAAPPYRIVYTGSVYEAQRDALARLLLVLERNPGLYRLEIYTPQSSARIRELGICGPDVVCHPFRDDEAISRVQSAADVLFFPLSFVSEIQTVIMSSSPGKMADYLAAGSPILVHAPRGSYLAEFFTARRAGLVVDEPNVDLLEEGLTTIAAGGAKISSMISCAHEAAELFSPEAARKSFWELITNAARPKGSSLQIETKRILLVGRAGSALTRWVNSLASGPYVVSVFSLDVSSGQAHFWPDAGMLLLSVPGPIEHTNTRIKSPTHNLTAVMKRSGRGLIGAMRNPDWGVRRLKHGPLASVGRPVAHDRVLPVFKFCVDGGGAIHPHAGVDPLTELAVDLSTALQIAKPDIIHSLDLVGAQVVALARTGNPRHVPTWLATEWATDSVRESASLGGTAVQLDDSAALGDFGKGGALFKLEEGIDLITAADRSSRHGVSRVYAAIFERKAKLLIS